jgi:hypothetical protein
MRTRISALLMIPPTLTIGAVALTFMALPVSAQDRMPPIPPEKYDEAQKKAAEEFQVARKGPVWTVFGAHTQPRADDRQPHHGRLSAPQALNRHQIIRVDHSGHRTRMDVGL